MPILFVVVLSYCHRDPEPWFPHKQFLTACCLLLLLAAEIHCSPWALKWVVKPPLGMTQLGKLVMPLLHPEDSGSSHHTHTHTHTHTGYNSLVPSPPAPEHNLHGPQCRGCGGTNIGSTYLRRPHHWKAKWSKVVPSQLLRSCFQILPLKECPESPDCHGRKKLEKGANFGVTHDKPE